MIAFIPMAQMVPAMSIALLVTMIVMYATGVYLLLDRSLTRVLLGVLLVGNATNLLIFLTSGLFGRAPIFDPESTKGVSDPLPQAFILTSIVITFGVGAFMLALIYRSWRLARVAEDEVLDDAHDLELAEADTLTTEEVTHEELAQAQEFEDESVENDQLDSRIETANAGAIFGEDAK